MFQLIESLILEPIRLPAKPGGYMAPGHVVKISEYYGDVVIERCDGFGPLGIVANRCFGENKHVDFTKIAEMFSQRMVANISRFDRRCEIRSGYSLYCSNNGLLTSNKPFEDSIVLAKVITPASKNNRYMQILWL